MDGWMDGWKNGWMDGCDFSDIVLLKSNLTSVLEPIVKGIIFKL